MKKYKSLLAVFTVCLCVLMTACRHGGGKPADSPDNYYPVSTGSELNREETEKPEKTVEPSKTEMPERPEKTEGPQKPERTDKPVRKNEGPEDISEDTTQEQIAMPVLLFSEYSGMQPFYSDIVV